MVHVSDIAPSEHNQNTPWVLLPNWGARARHNISRRSALEDLWQARSGDAFLSYETKLVERDLTLRVISAINEKRASARLVEDVHAWLEKTSATHSEDELGSSYGFSLSPRSSNDWHSNSILRYELAEPPADPFEASEADGQPTIPLGTLLKNGALAVTLICILSLLVWVLGSFVIIGPFVAVLTLVVTPIFYMMGRAIERKNKS